MRKRNDHSRADGTVAAPVLTRSGRMALEERARHLEEEVVPACGRRLRDALSDPNVTAEYQRALSELAEIGEVLRDAVDAEDLPADPQVVELGDAVTIEMPDGEIDRYVIVHPVEAPLDRERISSSSPMSKALLGHRLGEKVEVAAPSGAFEVTIRSVKR